ncbi:PAS domain S-box protein [Viridibacillus sp. YIM B01967]|uniref:histidine kinase n=1 Tax=Viridibacillus soli TaxID=2798301 RepID=A0ABS1H2D4_9BACL|nr:ATP-binding protein [Viridibacillus soli]MBK3493569.1 PAS domain S-box protein [Viridibacillus soli]
MKSLRIRLLIAFGFLYFAVLAGLGFILGQLFPVYVEDSIHTNSLHSHENIIRAIEKENIDLTLEQEQAISNAMPLDFGGQDLADSRVYLWLILTVILILTFMLLMAITARLIKSLVHPIDNVTNTALELAKGNYRARAYENVESPTIKLSNAVNVLARNLQDIMMIREMEQERLKTLIENMGSALIMIGREGHISIVNKSFLELFDVPFDAIYKQIFRDLGLPNELEQFVDHVFMTEISYRKQMQLEIQQEFRHMEVYGAPVIGEHGHWLGIVIIMHDITELKKLEQIRKDFVANVSHELRTPITSIRGFSETLLDGAYKDQGTLLSFLEIINKESNRLQMLILDLLELSKVEKHGFTVNIEHTSLKDVIVRATEMTVPRLEEKNMSFEAEIEQDVIVEGDSNRLIQVVMNLITNATTYSLENTKIKVKLYEQNNNGVIEIIDEGIGIEKTEIPRIFERFYRVDRARSRNSGGTGLGLAIVKHLIEAHHGKIQVDSVVGEGTTMRVILPQKQPN